MARLSNASLTPPPTSSPLNQLSAELGHLLARLQQTVLHPDPARERQLRTNQYERVKLGSNLEYARNSLTKLEQDATAILAPGRRAEVQADLNGKRELLELLLDRLQDFNKMAADDEESDDDTSDGEDILADIIPTPSESQASIVEDQEDEDATAADPPASTVTQMPSRTSDLGTETPSETLPTQTTQGLRARSTESPSATSTSSTRPQPQGAQEQATYATARAALFASRQRPHGTIAAPETSTATAEAILDQQAAEREDLSDKVFRMAQAMKKQQQSIYDSLESEKDVLSLASEGMERTGRGMEAARGRMGMLQRMTEGKGWWGRMMLYAWVYGLMVGLVLLVFVMPKLRF